MENNTSFFADWSAFIQHNPEQALSDLIKKHQQIPGQVDGLLAALQSANPGFVTEFNSRLNATIVGRNNIS